MKHDDILGLIGDTPLVGRTPRGGTHLFFKSSGEGTHTHIDGLKIDVRGRGGFLVVPPSERPGVGRYEFVRGTIKDFRGLPPIKNGALLPLSLVSNNRSRIKPDRESIPEGQRNRDLWLQAMREAPSCETRAELEDRMMKINDAHCSPPLGRDEVRKIVDSAWEHDRSGQNWVGRSYLQLETREYDDDTLTDDAIMLLLFLRKNHSDIRDNFAISPRGIATYGGRLKRWSERRIRNARSELVENGLLELERMGGRGKHDPSIFRFARSGVTLNPNLDSVVSIVERVAPLTPQRVSLHSGFHEAE